MNRNDFLIGYNLDVERLKKAFFSPPKKRTQKKKKRPLKNILFTFTITLILTVSVIFLFLKYDFLIIPRKPLEIKGSSLFKEKIISSVRVLNSDKVNLKATNSFIYLAFPPKEEINLSIDLKKPINLNNANFFLYLKKTTYPLKITLIAKDSNFFSNSLYPLIIELDKENDYYIPVVLKEEKLQNINLSMINQIRLSFYAENGKEPINEKNIMKKNWILLKDLVLVKK